MRVYLTASALESELSAEAYDNWLKSDHETEEEFIERKHGVDLADLVQIVIEEKLNEREKFIIRGFWFKGMSPKDLALKTDSSVSNIYKILKNTEEKIRMYLEYVIVYQDHLIKRELVPVSVRQAIADAAIKRTEGKSIGERLKKLRVNENIPRERLEASIRMQTGRLDFIEKGRSLPNTEELIKLTAFFNTTADYILFGKEG